MKKPKPKSKPKPTYVSGDQDLPFSEAFRQLHRAANDLEDLHLRMQGILSTLSTAADPEDSIELEEMDTGAQLQAVIRCVMADCIGPAIRDLRDMLLATEGAGAPKS
ncbi:MAG TPA: hypothetical protein VGG20_11300 [Thermoanaerobaculia bacterium]|jgi:hypothetical protein